MFDIAYGANKSVLHWKQDTVTWDTIVSWCDDPATKKDTVGYVLGKLRPTTRIHKSEPCTEMHRNKDGIESRSALCLDVDHPASDFLDKMDLTFANQALMHTTYSSAPDDKRYRLIVPTDRSMAPDEYIVAAQSLMQRLGAEQFDQSTDQPERFMYKPSAQDPAWFEHWVYTGSPIRVDELLDSFEKDLSTKTAPTNRRKRNPFEIEGVIGAFNRAYEDWDLLISTYELPYEKVDEDRYHLVGSRSEAGMGPVQDTVGLVYSHHANDPAFGKTCSAFDLVRLHMFGDRDENAKAETPVTNLPSHKAMVEVATTDHRVTAELVGIDFDSVMDEDVVVPQAWKINLQLTPRSGHVRDTIQNWDLIVEHERMFTNLRFNELTMSPEFKEDVSWRTVTDRSRTVTGTDRWEIVHYLEREYNGFAPSKVKVDAMIDTKAARNLFNPVREYLAGLKWDGVLRLDECLPGVRPTPHTRLIARKVMVAAVARMMDPGCKWDHTLVLFGPEGMGKSWWIDKMACGWSSSLGRLDNKDTLLVMQRSWILVSDEGHSLKKTDHDAQKEFLTRTADVFRMPYDRETLLHPRHCVIWSTTNDQVFLRRQEGNRRFLIVHCEDKVDFDKITDDYIAQVWAEAVHRYNQGERLYFDDEESAITSVEREPFIEEDALAGMIDEYLNTPVPEDWLTRSIESRLQWFSDRADGFVPEGTMLLDRVCTTQIWIECLRRRRGDARRNDLLDLANIMQKMPGWVSLNGTHRLPGYGPQHIYERNDLL